MGGADLHECTQVVARGIYPRGGKDLHQDPEERFKLVRSKHRSFLFFELSKRQSKIRNWRISDNFNENCHACSKGCHNQFDGQVFISAGIVFL